jgi:hypothetical protein
VAGYTGPEVSMKRPAFAAVLVLLTALLAGPPPAAAATTARPYDFDGNGYPDLVVGAPDLTVRTAPFAGGVVILPASARGPASAAQVVTQSSRGVPGASEAGDKFGKTVVSADFDRDGYADLAVGQPGEDSASGLFAAGAVTVVHGSSRGLDTMRSTGFTTLTEPEQGAHFGEALAAGDFNGDSYPDLAIGAPSFVQFPVKPTGTVTILPGGPAGVRTTSATVLNHDAGPDFDFRFGSELAAADLNEDGTTDLVVGSAGLDYVSVTTGYPGSISYCLGGTGGLTGCHQLWHEGMSEMTSLVVGNMVGTATPEIVVGWTNSVYLSAGGLVLIEVEGGDPTIANVRLLSQDLPGIPGHSQPRDHFGSSLAMGDIDRDGYDDLAIGADGEDLAAGRVTVVHGGPTGWRTRGNYIYDQNSGGIPGAHEPGDRFGSSVTLLDHDRDGHLDLTVGIEGENNHLGGITLLRGSGHGFTTTGARRISLTGLGYAYPAESSFGATLGG